MLSHELRNPLAPIRRQVTHLTRLVDDLLDVTRVARGKIQLRLEPVELGALLRRTVEDHRGGFEARGLQLESDVDPRPTWVRADTTRVVQITSNLLANAWKFTPRGGRVEVYVFRRDTAAVLRVVDSGAGISAEVIEHVFEPFAQAPQTLDRARGGLGLGLARR